MKVLVFNHAFFYPSETFVYKQINGLPEEVDIELMGYEFRGQHQFPHNKKEIQINKYGGWFDRKLTAVFRRLSGLSLGTSFFNYLRIKKIVAEVKPDLIHVHFGFNSLFIYDVAKRLNIPLVVTFHGLDASPQLLRKIDYRSKIKRVIKYSRSIIIVSPHMMDTLKLERYKTKVHLIPCSVDPAEFTVVRAESSNGKPVRILHSGRLTSKKGVPDLIRVCIELNKIFQDIQIDIVGDGNDLKLCRQLINESGATNIHLHGVQSQKEVRRFMADADIFVLNSRVGEGGDMEGTPVSIQEAMSMQLAVVSTKHAGIPLLISNDENGLLVEERDNQALKEALIRLINDPAMRIRLGINARKTIEEKFTVEKMNRKIFDVYKDSLK